MDTDEKIRNLDENNKPAPTKTGKYKIGKVILWMVLALLFFGSLYGVYYWQHKKTDSQAKEISSLKSKVADASKQLAEAQSNTSDTEAKVEPTTDELVIATAEAYCEAGIDPATKKALVFTNGKAGPEQKTIIYSTDKKFAYINARCDDGSTEPQGSGSAYNLKLVNGTWVMLYRGQQGDPQLDKLYGIPVELQQS